MNTEFLLSVIITTTQIKYLEKHLDTFKTLCYNIGSNTGKVDLDNNEWNVTLSPSAVWTDSMDRAELCFFTSVTLDTEITTCSGGEI